MPSSRPWSGCQMVFLPDNLLSHFHACTRISLPNLQPLTRELITASSTDKVSEIQPSPDNKVLGCGGCCWAPSGAAAWPPRASVQLVPRRRKYPTEEGAVGGLRTLLQKKEK